MIPAVSPRYGGPSQAIFEMCRALAKRELDVSLATTDIDGTAKLPVQIGALFEYRGVRTIFFSSRLGERLNYSPALAHWLHANVKNFDVVHIHAVFSHACLAAAKACRQHRVPYIVRPLGSLDPWSMQQKPVRKALMWRMAVGRMMKGATAIHYTTSEEKRLAETSLGLSRGFVVPLGIDLAAIQAILADGIFRQAHPTLGDRPYVLALSRIHPKKNFELLLRAFLELIHRPELKAWRLVVAGDGDENYLSSLRALADQLGGAGKVVFAGWLEGSLKASALQGASLFALPSHQENFGIAAAEAMACAVPVVVSQQVNLANEIAQARAGWVSSLELDDFSRALAEAMSGEDERKARGAAGKLFVEQHLSWAKAAGDLEKLYSTTLSDKGPDVSTLERSVKCAF